MAVLQHACRLGFVSLLAAVEGRTQNSQAPITLDLPASFTIRYPADNPKQCYRVRRPANGKITATVQGEGRWDVCIGDQMCPLDCMDSGQRTATTEPLTQGLYYFVRVVSKSPGVAGTLSIFPAGTAQATPDVAGQWKESDGGCAGSVWTIGQEGAQVGSIQARITCSNGSQDSWRASQIRWSGNSVLSYTVTHAGGAVEQHVTSFQGDTGTVEVYHGPRRIAVVHIARVSAAAHPHIGGQWREADGGCAGSRWTISQQGAQVTALAASLTCSNGSRDSWRASNIRWTSANTLTYTVTHAAGFQETHATTFQSDTGIVEVRHGGRRVATVRIARE